MAPLALSDTLTLKHTGDKMPQLGFGVWASPQDKCLQSCVNALKAGYRHIDTAQAYSNEAEVGRAVQQSGLPRDQIFVTTKFFRQGDPQEIYESVAESVRKCDPRDGGYVDLFLIHAPRHGPEERRKSWLVLERLVAEGKARNIGVSNYGPNHIEEMKSYATIWPPAVNQIELHPWAQQREVVKYCEDNGIVIEAYCPIVRNRKAGDPTLASIAKKHGVTPNQVLLRYSLQKGWAPLPKSDDPGRMRANADLYAFELDAKDMDRLDKLDEGDKGSICPANLPGPVP